MNYLEPIVLIIGTIAAGFYVWARYLKPEPPCAYTEWLRGVQRLNPDYKPPCIMGPNGKHVRNPEYTEGQIIKHE